MASPLNYNGGLTLSFQVSDRKRSAAWYQEVLGFTFLQSLVCNTNRCPTGVTTQDPRLTRGLDVEDIGWCELATEIKGVNVGLSQVEKPKVGAGPVPTFGVEDIDKARKKLEANDVRFDGDTIEFPGMVKLATFYDPDGNALMLFQDLQGG